MTPYECPLCQSDLTSDPIPEEWLDAYGGATHYSRVMGLYSLERDRTIAYRCPDCNGEWDRIDISKEEA